MNEQKKSTHYLSLQPSEMAVFRAACQIYSGYIASGQATEDTSDQYMKKSINEAIRIARSVDQAVQSDDELG